MSRGGNRKGNGLKINRVTEKYRRWRETKTRGENVTRRTTETGHDRQTGTTTGGRKRERAGTGK